MFTLHGFCVIATVAMIETLTRLRTIVTLLAPTGELLQNANPARPAFLHPAASYNMIAN